MLRQYLGQRQAFAAPPLRVRMALENSARIRKRAPSASLAPWRVARSRFVQWVWLAPDVFDGIAGAQGRRWPSSAAQGEHLFALPKSQKNAPAMALEMEPSER